MAVYDNRTKPDTQWTYYVVDHLPTMSNIYRFDTVQEAIDKFKSLPDHQISAIGSSLHGRHEIDHIHKIDGKAVLVRDMDRMQNPIWRESTEIAEAVAAMRQQLRVEFEKSFFFGAQTFSIAVPLMDGEPKLSSHLKDKQLDPKASRIPFSSITEFFVEGQGWTPFIKFFEDMDNRVWTREAGYPVPFITKLNVRYVDKSRHMGQVDISPSDFLILKEAYERPQDRKPGLDEKISVAGAKAVAKTSEEKGKSQTERAI